MGMSSRVDSSFTQRALLLLALVQLGCYASRTRPCSKDTGQCPKRCKDGFFGFECKYKCRCKNQKDVCNEDNGHCHSGCPDGWFGPGCHYASYPLVIRQGMEWANDNNPDSCYDGRRSYLEFNLGVPIHFTWMRLEFRNDVGYSPDLKPIFNNTYYGTAPCVNGLEVVTHKENKRTLDIMCTTNIKVKAIGFSGKLVRHLCSVYVSAGRLLGFKRPEKSIFTTHRLSTQRLTGLLEQTFEPYVQLSIPYVPKPKRKVCDRALIHEFGGVMSFDFGKVDLPRTTRFVLHLIKYRGHPEMWTHFNLTTVGSNGIKGASLEQDTNYTDDSLVSLFKDKSWDLKILNIKFDVKQFEFGYCVPNCTETPKSTWCTDRCVKECNKVDEVCLGKLNTFLCIRYCGSQKRHTRTDCEDYCCNRRLVNFTLSAFTYNPYPKRTKYYEFTREDCSTRCRRVQTKLEVVTEQIQEFFKHVQLSVYADSVCLLKNCSLTCECPDSKQCFASTGFCPQCNNSCIPGGKSIVATGGYFRNALDNQGLFRVAKAVTAVSTFVVLGTIAAILVTSFKGPEMTKATMPKQRGVTEPASGPSNEHPGDVIDPTTKAANEWPAE